MGELEPRASCGKLHKLHTHNWQKLLSIFDDVAYTVTSWIVIWTSATVCLLWQGIRIEATWHLAWYWPQSLVWFDLTFQLCICEMTRSTTWHNWDGMMEPSRQVF